MSFRSGFVTLSMLILAIGYWVVAFAQLPKEGKQAGKKNAKKAAPKQADLAQPASPIAIDESKWPADDTLTIRLALGLKDTEPTEWDGRVDAGGAKILRVRPWRFGPNMTIDERGHSWKCRSWLGPTPAERVFDRHLPSMPQPFVRPGILIDLAGSAAENGTLQVETGHGKFSVELARLGKSGGESRLDGRVWVERAVFGFPVAARSKPDQLAWYDDPALAVRPDQSDEVAVSYLSYSQDTTSDAIFVRRRIGGKWQTPELVSEAKGDHYRSAVRYDSMGSLWVVYAAQVADNWDLYARRWSDNQWQPVARLSSNPQPDIQHVLIADNQKGLWLVWQGFRNGQSDILARRWDGGTWGEEQRVSTSPANDWHPAATALPGGGLAVAWDTYEAGNYDVCCRATKGSGTSWGKVVRVTQQETLEARPTIAADRAGRLWVAYDTSGPHWGKDTGFRLELAKAPQGTRLYEERGVAVSIVEPGTNRILSPNEPAVRFDSFNSTMHEQVEYPQLISDDAGRMWLVMRRRAMLSMSRRGAGRMFAWEVLVSRFDVEKGHWTEPTIVADSLGRMDSLSGIGVGRAGLWIAWSHDHRVYSTNRPDASSIFAGCLRMADVSADNVAMAKFAPAAQRTAPPTPPPSHPHEAADVARIRNHAITVGGKTYHIYRGDLHRHTETSSDGGGDGSILDAYRYALDAAAMDFLLVTDHHDGSREYDWWRREKFNDLFRVGESFTGLFGYERSVSYPNGHRNVFFAMRGTRPLANLPQEAGREPVGTGKFLYPHLRERGGICFSHTSATGMGTDWRDNDPELEPLVEIFQGDRTNYEKLGAPWSADAGDSGTQEGGFEPLGYVNLALAKGYKLGFQSSSDHLSTHLSYSCILAERNTRASLMEAMKKRHAYAATDNILLDVRAPGDDGEHIMGDVFSCAGWPKLRASVTGTGKLSDVVLIKDDRVVYTSQPADNEVEFEFTDMQAAKGNESYYYVRVVQADRRIAWSSPLWITSK